MNEKLQPLKLVAGSMPTATLEKLLAQFPANAQITRYASAIIVRSPARARVLSAISATGKVWNVRAVEGLITTTEKV